jgi:hypothetical protein
MYLPHLGSSWNGYKEIYGLKVTKNVFQIMCLINSGQFMENELLPIKQEGSVTSISQTKSNSRKFKAFP